MGYLILHDYNLPIQDRELNQIITNDPSVRISAEAVAQEEISSKIRQRYDVDREFQDTTPWDYSLVYMAGDLIEINYSQYNSANTYPLNSLVVHSGKGYICIVAITVAEAFNPAKWTYIGEQYDLFYAITPEADFYYKQYYQIGDKVFWKNKKYTSLQESIVPDHFTKLQYTSQLEIPYINTWPDDPRYGTSAWGTGVSYSVPAGTLPTNTTYWKKGDNRSKQAVLTMVKIAIYHMCSRVAPNNVSITRKTGYDESIQWLVAVANGTINADLPEIQPEQGSPVMWGGNVRRINQW